MVLGEKHGTNYLPYTILAIPGEAAETGDSL